MKDNFIAISSDHGGYLLKQRIIEIFSDAQDWKKNFEINDFGTNSLESVHYPEYGFQAARSVATGESSFGIIICTSGIGMSIVANKVKGIRAALCHDAETAMMARKHNNANILILAAKKHPNNDTLMPIISEFYHTDFEAGRHQIRLQQITDYENNRLINK